MRCVGHRGLEETIVVPVQLGSSSDTIGDLLDKIRQRVHQVPPEEIESLHLDQGPTSCGRLHEDDPVDMLMDGDKLVCGPSEVLCRDAPRVSSSAPIASRPLAKRPKPAPAVEYVEYIEDDANPASLPPWRRLPEEPREAPPACLLSRARRLERSRSPRGLTISRDDTPPPPRSRGTQRSSGASAWASRSSAGTTRDDDADDYGQFGQKEGKWSPLLKAAYNGNLARVEEELEMGADVNGVVGGSGGKTAIYYAIRFEHVKVVRRLLQEPDLDVFKEMRGGKGWTTPIKAAYETGTSSQIWHAFLDAGFSSSDTDRTSDETPPDSDRDHWVHDRCDSRSLAY